MKAKHKRGKPAPRNTRAKRVARLAKQDPGSALEFELFGEHSDAISKMSSGDIDRKSIAHFIQNWLFIAEYESDPKLKRLVAWKREEMEKRAVLVLCDHLRAGGSNFFRKFADTLDREVAIRKAAMLENVDRTTAEFKLLAHAAYSDKPANLSEMAREIVDRSFASTPPPKDKAAQERIKSTREKRMASTRRNLTDIAKRFGVKTLPPGRPPK